MASNPNFISPVISDSSAVADGLEDIRYLLTLETYRRYKDDEINIRRQVEEKMRQHKLYMTEYLNWYGKFVKLIKLCEMRKFLEQKYPLDNEVVDEAKANIQQITAKITTGALRDYLSPGEIEKCTNSLSRVRDNANLSKLQEEVAEVKAAVLAIQTAMETVEVNVEKGIVQGLDYFVAELQMDINK